MPLSYRLNAWFRATLGELVATLRSPIFWLSLSAFLVAIGLIWFLFSMVMQYDTQLRFYGMANRHCRDLPDIDVFWLIYCLLFAFLSLFYAAGEAIAFTHRLPSARNDPIFKNPLFISAMAFLSFMAFLGLGMYLILSNCR